MKLTTHIREAFVRSVMDDVPRIDYSEQIKGAIQEEARDKLPPKVRALYDDKDLRGYLGTKYVKGHYVYAAPDFDPSAVLLKKIDTLKKRAEAQSEKRATLQNRLKAAANAHTTRKGLADALPEFAKYLPADAIVASRQVPVVTNVVADFVKAGWPKDKSTKKEVVAV